MKVLRSQVAIRGALFLSSLVALAACQAEDDPDLAPTAVTYDGGPFVGTVGVALSDIRPRVAGGAPSAFAIAPGLPDGLGFDVASGRISGTPGAVSVVTTYEVTASNAQDSASTTLRLSVEPALPTLIDRLTVTDAGESVTSVTNGYEDTVIGPILVGGVTYTLRIPAVAIGADVELKMTPVTLGNAPFESFGGVRFEPSGTTFRVPATLVAEGLPDVSVASAVLNDDGNDATLTFIPHANGAAEAFIEHFSVASIVDAAETEAAIGAAGLARVPTDTLEAAPLLAQAFHDTVMPAIHSASESLTAFVFAQRLLVEWRAATQARALHSSPFSSLAGRTFGDAGSDAAEELVRMGQGLLADLSQPRCLDGSGQLSHPFDWFGAMAHVAAVLRVLGGDSATPDDFAPCLTIALTPSVLTQGGSIRRDQRFIQVFLGIDATTPNGITAPMAGSYQLDVVGATSFAGDDRIFFDATSPGLQAVDLDRGEECTTRSSTIEVAVTGALLDTLGLVNISLDPVTAVLTFRDPLAFAAGPDTCQPPTITVSPAVAVVEPGGTKQLVATTAPDTFDVVWSTNLGTVDAQGLFTAGPETPAVVQVLATSQDGATRGSATIAILPLTTYMSTNSTAIVTSGAFSQGALWSWTLDLSAASSTSEVTLTRAERVDPPETPPFRVTAPITAISRQGLVLRLGQPDELELFGVQFFAEGGARVDIRGPGLPQALCDFCSPASLLDVLGWSNISFAAP